jgi:hypothetical protein
MHLIPWAHRDAPLQAVFGTPRRERDTRKDDKGTEREEWLSR